MTATTASAPTGPTFRARFGRAVPYLLLAPGLLWLVIFYVIPAVQMFTYSISKGTLETGFEMTLTADAYATATALYALHEAGRLEGTDRPYRRGADYLLRNQAADGSWYVASRAPKFQPYFEGGFPYGHDQWISQMATGWASAALSFAIPDARAAK